MVVIVIVIAIVIETNNCGFGLGYSFIPCIIFVSFECVNRVENGNNCPFNFGNYIIDLNSNL